MVDGVKIIVVFDVGHLDKCDRNNLLSKHLEIDFRDQEKSKNMQMKIVKWEHFDTAYEKDARSKTQYRSLPKLTDRHVKGGKIRKMKNIFSRQVLSPSMKKFIDRAVHFNGKNILNLILICLSFIGI